MLKNRSKPERLASSRQAAGAERRRYLRLVILGAVVIVAMFTATMGVVIWQLRQNAITDATAEIEKLDHALAELTERSFQSCDLVIAGIVDDLTGAGPITGDELRRQATSRAFHQALRAQLASLPQAEAIAVIGDDGSVLSQTRNYPPQPSVNVADRDYFIALRDQPDLPHYISEPVQNRSTGAWTIYLARRINGPNGSLAGLVLAALQLDYFEDLYRDVNPGEGSVIGLYRNDGKLLARYPQAHAVVGHTLPQSQSFADIARNGGASLVWTTSGVLHDRIAAAERSLRDYPLIITVARSETAMLSTWWSQALAVAASAAAVALAIGFVAWLLYRQFVASELVAAARIRADEETEARREAQRAVAQAEATRRELERSEARFRDIAEVAADLIWETDRQHRFTQFTGDRSNGQLDDPGAEAIGKTRWEIAGADPKTDEHWRQHKADLDAHRPFRQFRFARRAPTGTTKHVSVSGKPFFDEAGEFCGYRGTATNESAVVEAEERARRSDVLLREAVDAISEGFVIYDHEDRLVLCNEAYRCLYPEAAAAKVPGARFEDILRLGMSDDPSADASGRDEEWLEQRLREHREPSGPLESHLQDGRWVLVSERRMASGGVAGLRIDITALKKVQASLRESQAQLNLAQRVSNTGSMARDYRSEQTVWSDELLRICGLKPDEAPTTVAGFLQLVHPEDRARVEAAVAAGENATRRPDMQYRIVRRDGTVRWVHREIEVVLDAAGKPLSVISTFKDITEQRAADEHRTELEKQLRHSQKLEALGTLAGGIAHDLNNTLVPILALSKMAMKTLPGDHKVRKDLGTIAQACERARDLVRQILTFSRKQELVKERIDLAAVTRETLQMLRASLPASIRLTEEIAEVPAMLGDAGQLQQVIVNLIANAAQAIGERPGSIAVAVAASKAEEPTGEPRIRLSVADSGCGIAEQDLARIFEPFFTTKPVGVGTGLGLAVVHGIVAGHGGSINVSSAPGKGTEFSILLPPLEGDRAARAFDRSAA